MLVTKNLVSPLITPLMAVPVSLHIFPSFPQKGCFFHFTSWDGCPRTRKSTCGRSHFRHLTQMCSKGSPALSVGSVEYNQNITRPEIRAQEFRLYTSCIPSAASRGLLRRPWDLGADLPQAPRVSSSLRASPLPGCPVVKTSLAIMRRTVCSFQRIRVSSLCVWDRWMGLIPFLR